MPESYIHSPEDNDDYIPYSTVKKNHSSYGRIPYRKLLYTVEWNEKRRRILNRQNIHYLIFSASKLLSLQ